MKTQFRYLAAFAISAVCGCATVTDCQAKTPEAAIDAFMREYVGVQFGDDIAKINGYGDAQYKIPMKKKFRYFDQAMCYYRKGKLYRINVWTDIGKEYSQSSADAQLNKAMSKLAEEMCLPKAYFEMHMICHKCLFSGGRVEWEKTVDKKGDDVKLAYFVRGGITEWPNFNRYCIDIVDTKLDASLKSSTVKAPTYKPVTEEMRRNWGIPLPDAE